MRNRFHSPLRIPNSALRRLLALVVTEAFLCLSVTPVWASPMDFLRPRAAADGGQMRGLLHRLLSRSQEKNSSRVSPPPSFLEKATALLRFYDSPDRFRFLLRAQMEPLDYQFLDLFRYNLALDKLVNLPKEGDPYVVSFDPREGLALVHVDVNYVAVKKALSNRDVLGTFECQTCFAVAGYMGLVHGTKGFIGHFENANYPVLDKLIRQFRENYGTTPWRLVVFAPVASVVHAAYSREERKRFLKEFKKRYHNLHIEEYGSNARLRGLILTHEGIGSYEGEGTLEGDRYHLVRFLPFEHPGARDGGDRNISFGVRRILEGLRLPAVRTEVYP